MAFSKPGPGRPPGAATKLDRELRERALKGSKETPLDYMLRILADPKVTPQRRDDMAKAAAPYLHARLNAVTVTGQGGGPLQVQIVRFSDLPTTDAAAAAPEAGAVAATDDDDAGQT